MNMNTLFFITIAYSYLCALNKYVVGMEFITNDVFSKSGLFIEEDLFNGEECVITKNGNVLFCQNKDMRCPREYHICDIQDSEKLIQAKRAFSYPTNIDTLQPNHTLKDIQYITHIVMNEEGKCMSCMGMGMGMGMNTFNNIDKLELQSIYSKWVYSDINREKGTITYDTMWQCSIQNKWLSYNQGIFINTCTYCFCDDKASKCRNVCYNSNTVSSMKKEEFIDFTDTLRLIEDGYDYGYGNRNGNEDAVTKKDNCFGEDTIYSSNTYSSIYYTNTPKLSCGYFSHVNTNKTIGVACCKNSYCQDTPSCESCIFTQRGSSCLSCDRRTNTYLVNIRGRGRCMKLRQIHSVCNGYYEIHPYYRTAQCVSCNKTLGIVEDKEAPHQTKDGFYIYGGCRCLSQDNYGKSCERKYSKDFCDNKGLYNLHTDTCLCDDERNCETETETEDKKDYIVGCKNGYVSYINNEPSCICKLGWTGKNCDTSICIYGNYNIDGIKKFISNHRELSLDGMYKNYDIVDYGNELVNKDDTQICICEKNYYGKYCGNHCLKTCNFHGDRCNDLDVCVCHSGWIGKKCENYILEYTSNSIHIHLQNTTIFDEFVANLSSSSSSSSSIYTITNISIDSSLHIFIPNVFLYEYSSDGYKKDYKVQNERQLTTNNLQFSVIMKKNKACLYDNCVPFTINIQDIFTRNLQQEQEDTRPVVRKIYSMIYFLNTFNNINNFNGTQSKGERFNNPTMCILVIPEGNISNSYILDTHTIVLDTEKTYYNFMFIYKNSSVFDVVSSFNNENKRETLLSSQEHIKTFIHTIESSIEKHIEDVYIYRDDEEKNAVLIHNDTTQITHGKGEDGTNSIQSFILTRNVLISVFTIVSLISLVVLAKIYIRRHKRRNIKILENKRKNVIDTDKVEDMGIGMEMELGMDVDKDKDKDTNVIHTTTKENQAYEEMECGIIKDSTRIIANNLQYYRKSYKPTYIHKKNGNHKNDAIQESPLNVKRTKNKNTIVSMIENEIQTINTNPILYVTQPML